MIESSLVLRPLRELCRDSVVCRYLVRLGRSTSGRDSWIATRLARRAPTRAFTRTAALARASVIFGAIDRWLASVPAAWRDSAVHGWLDRRFGSVDGPQRVRLAGWAVLSAVLTNALLDASTLVNNWRAATLSALMTAIGLFLVLACRPLAAAWQSRR